MGLFPLVLPSIFVCVNGDYKGLKNSLVCGLSFALFLSILLCFEPARAYMKQYFVQQVIASLNGERANTHRAYIFILLFKEIFFQVILIVVAFLVALYKQNKSSFFNISLVQKKLLCCALVSSLPIALSTKFFSFYLLSSLPYYSLFTASLFFAWTSWDDCIGVNTFKSLKIGFIVLPVLISCYLLVFGASAFSRDVKLRAAIALIEKPQTVIYTCLNHKFDYRVIAQAYRINKSYVKAILTIDQYEKRTKTPILTSPKCKDDDVYGIVQ